MTFSLVNVASPLFGLPAQVITGVFDSQTSCYFPDIWIPSSTFLTKDISTSSFFFFNFIFKRHKIVLVLPNIKMNLLNTCSGISQISLFGLCLSEISFSCWTQIGSQHCFYPLVQVLLFVSPKHHILNSAASNGPSGCIPHWMIATGTRLDLCLV